MHGSTPSPGSAAGAETMSATKRTAGSRPVPAAPDVGLHDPGGEARAVLRQAVPRRIRRGWLVRRALLAADIFGLLAAFFATELLFAGDRLINGVGIGPESVI